MSWRYPKLHLGLSETLTNPKLMVSQAVLPSQEERVDAHDGEDYDLDGEGEEEPEPELDLVEEGVELDLPAEADSFEGAVVLQDPEARYEHQDKAELEGEASAPEKSCPDERAEGVLPEWGPREEESGSGPDAVVVDASDSDVEKTPEQRPIALPELTSVKRPQPGPGRLECLRAQLAALKLLDYQPRLSVALQVGIRLTIPSFIISKPGWPSRSRRLTPSAGPMVAFAAQQALG